MLDLQPILTGTHITLRHEVLFAVAERNQRSRRAAEKLGAELAGAEDAPRWGQIHVIYRLTPELWARGAVPGYGPELAQ
jgi:RimJ/RimL family protein N-acetyltransferase